MTLHLTVIMDVLGYVCRLCLFMDSINMYGFVWCWCGKVLVWYVVGVVLVWCWCGVGVVLLWCGVGVV